MVTSNLALIFQHCSIKSLCLGGHSICKAGKSSPLVAMDLQGTTSADTNKLATKIRILRSCSISNLAFLEIREDNNLAVLIV